MDKLNIHRFLIELTGNASLETVEAGEWLMTNCILAPWRHDGGTDSKPSFGIHIVEDGASVFHCFTCKSKGTLPRLVRLYEEYTGEDRSGVLDGLSMGEMLGPQLPEWDNRSVTTKDKLGVPLDEMLVDAYEPAAHHPYLRRRGITPNTAERLGLRVDPDNYGVERILFPVRAPNGGLYGFSGRATTHAEPRVRDYHGLPKKLLLLGSHLIEQDTTKSIVVVEGLFDFAKVFQAGYRAVAVMFSGITEPQARILKTFGSPVISFLDNDKAGEKGHKELLKKLGNVVPVLEVPYPRRGANGKTPKDPGDLSEEQIATAISRADLA